MLFDEAFLRKLERLTLLARRAVIGQTQGERRSPKRGLSVEFADFRPYTSGDDFRRIDWNAYARLERFFIKLYVEEEDLTVHLLLDASPSMNWGTPSKLEYALKAAGALGYISLLSLDRVTVSLLERGHLAAQVPSHLPAMRGKRSATQLFDYLERASLPSDARPSGASPNQGSELLAYAASARQPGPTVLFSDLMADGWRRGLTALGDRGFEVTVIHLLAPDEADPAQFADPPLQGDFRLWDREGSTGVEITADFVTLERYRQRLLDWQAEWRHFCHARGMQYLAIDTRLPLEELLFAWLRKYGVLQ